MVFARAGWSRSRRPRRSECFLLPPGPGCGVGVGEPVSGAFDPFAGAPDSGGFLDRSGCSAVGCGAAGGDGLLPGLFPGIDLVLLRGELVGQCLFGVFQCPALALAGACASPLGLRLAGGVRGGDPLGRGPDPFLPPGASTPSRGPLVPASLLPEADVLGRVDLRGLVEDLLGQRPLPPAWSVSAWSVSGWSRRSTSAASQSRSRLACRDAFAAIFGRVTTTV